MVTVLGDKKSETFPAKQGAGLERCNRECILPAHFEEGRLVSTTTFCVVLVLICCDKWIRGSVTCTVFQSSTCRRSSTPSNKYRVQNYSEYSTRVLYLVLVPRLHHTVVHYSMYRNLSTVFFLCTLFSRFPMNVLYNV